MEVKKEKDDKASFVAEVAAAVACTLGAVNCGLGVGWLSPALPQMRAPGGLLDVLDPELSAFVESWMAGGFPLGALICTPLAALVSETLGRKNCAMLAGLPFVANSLFILTTSNVYLLLVGRFIMGMGVALVSGNIQPYIGETVSPEVRGRLSSLMLLLYIIGMTTSYVIGGFISYVAGAVCMLSVALASIIFLIFVPETPHWLVKHGKLERAATSIAWLRRVNVDDPRVHEEMKKLQEAAKVVHPSTIRAAKQLVLSKPLRRGFLICALCIFLQGWMGMTAVHSYSVSIFLSSGAASLSAEGAATVYGCIQLLGALSSTILVDRLGRKLLMSISSLGVTLSMLVIGGYFQMQSLGYDLQSVQWVPVLSLSICVYTYTIGMGGVPFILIVDLLTHEVRSIAVMLIMIVLNIDLFIILLFFGRAVTTFGEYPIFYFFSLVSGFTFLIVISFIPETKGKTSEEIQEMLSK